MDLGTFRATYTSHGSGSLEYVLALVCGICQCPELSFSRGQLNFFTNHKDNPMDQIFVFFSDEKSVGVKTMRKCVIRYYHIHYNFLRVDGADY